MTPLPDDTETPTPQWVWYSTQTSRATGAVSILAVVETLLCVIAYWGAWLWFGQVWQLWLVLLSTLLVLFRSEQSVAKSEELYDHMWDNVPPSERTFLSWRGTGGFCLATVLSLAILYYLQPHKFLGIDSLFGTLALTIPLSLLMADILTLQFIRDAPSQQKYGTVLVLIGVVIAIVGYAMTTQFYWNWLATALLALPIVFLAFFFFVSFALLALIVFVRVIAIFSQLPAGLRAVPQNWRQLMWTNDPLQEPQFLPGVPDTALTRTFGEFWTDDALGKVVGAIFTGVLFIPTYIWRWTVKSTAWFYLPLLWLGMGWVNLRGDELLIWGKSYTTKLLNIAGLLVAFALLAGSAISYFVPLEFLKLQLELADQSPMTPFGWLMVLDWQAFLNQPWQWFYVPSWLFTIALFFKLDACRKDITQGDADPASRAKPLRHWMWVSNARYVLTNAGLIIALYYFLTAMGAWTDIATFFGRTT